MNHPEIPPNSKFFDVQKSFGYTWFTLNWADRRPFFKVNLSVNSDKLSTDMRFIIAAVAIEEWMKTLSADAEISEDIDVIDLCEKWRKWARGEEWL